MPLEHISGAVGIVDRLGYKAKGMISSPLLALLLETIDNELVYFLLLHLIIIVHQTWLVGGLKAKFFIKINKKAGAITYVSLHIFCFCLLWRN
jgi:hypothetical protein